MYEIHEGQPFRNEEDFSVNMQYFKTIKAYVFGMEQCVVVTYSNLGTGRLRKHFSRGEKKECEEFVADVTMICSNDSIHHTVNATVHLEGSNYHHHHRGDKKNRKSKRNTEELLMGKEDGEGCAVYKGIDDNKEGVSGSFDEVKEARKGEIEKENEKGNESRIELVKDDEDTEIITEEEKNKDESMDEREMMIGTVEDDEEREIEREKTRESRSSNNGRIEEETGGDNDDYDDDSDDDDDDSDDDDETLKSSIGLEDKRMRKKAVRHAAMKRACKLIQYRPCLQAGVSSLPSPLPSVSSSCTFKVCGKFEEILRQDEVRICVKGELYVLPQTESFSSIMYAYGKCVWVNKHEDLSDFVGEAIDLFGNVCYTHVLFAEERKAYMDYFLGNAKRRRYDGESAADVYGKNHLLRFFSRFEFVDRGDGIPTIVSRRGMIKGHWEAFIEYITGE
jgi:hypothetical protein